MAYKDDDPISDDLRKLQAKNGLFVYNLNYLGGNGNCLQAKLKENNTSEESKPTLQY